MQHKKYLSTIKIRDERVPVFKKERLVTKRMFVPTLSSFFSFDDVALHGVAAGLRAR